ncbi:hypothetical protein CCHR01_12057 [Colletotrichum chrysophilum]|uniref:Uncharacterized protein n=1 Tax=Colletotrichum chrysophilum TaxID=1836956 RepID=A0AAD9ACW1_9PEZI|nr:hypothetical protein CCHR01_12057 [Colletotrichum chrysophilum]
MPSLERWTMRAASLVGSRRRIRRERELRVAQTSELGVVSRGLSGSYHSGALGSASVSHGSEALFHGRGEIENQRPRLDRPGGTLAGDGFWGGGGGLWTASEVPTGRRPGGGGCGRPPFSWEHGLGCGWCIVLSRRSLCVCTDMQAVGESV